MTRRAAALLLLAAAGALQTPAYFAPAAWPLPIAGAALLAAAVSGASARGAALHGWAYGCGWLVAATGWLYISMHRYGELAAPLAAAAVLVLAAALSLYLAAAMAAWARWRRRRPLADAASFAAVWLLAELARAAIFTGFPWAASGYAQVDGPLAGLAPWIGVYGIGALGAGIGALVAFAVRGRAWMPALAAAALIVLPAALRPLDFTTAAGPPLAVSLLQTNVAQDEKFAPEHVPQTLAWLAGALRAARGELVVAPETAEPLLPDQLADAAPGYWEALQARFAGSAQAALVGVPLGDNEHGYTNSVVGLGGTGASGYRYDKLHLVPFGEFIPTGFRWFTDALAIPLGDFARGVPNPPSFAVRGQRVAPNICYEDLFGEELARRFEDPARAPTLFANVSNIAWFGDSIALPQHLQISRMRALEFQRPMVRSTNTGTTAIVDHRGRVVASLAPLTRGVLEGRVEGRDGLTPYAWWAARFGLWPLVAVALAALLAAACLRAE